MSRLTFQEKMLWAQLIGIMVAVAFYAHYLQHSAPGHHYFHALVIVLLLVFASVRTFVRYRSSNTVEDERDRSIAAIGARWSNLILWLGLIVVLVLYWDHGAWNQGAWNQGSVHPVDHLIGILFHLLVLAGCARILRELVAYRMSA